MKLEIIKYKMNIRKLSMLLLVVMFFITGCSKYKTIESTGILNVVENDSVIVKEENPIHKYEYFAKLDDLDESITQSDTLHNEESTSEMIELEENKFSKWDDMLSEICELLIDQLNKNELEEFKDKQLEWLEYRENTAKEEADKFDGMKSSKVQYNSTLTKLTKKRCYEIVIIYLQ